MRNTPLALAVSFVVVTTSCSNSSSIQDNSGNGAQGGGTAGTGGTAFSGGSVTSSGAGGVAGTKAGGAAWGGSSGSAGVPSGGASGSGHAVSGGSGGAGGRTGSHAAAGSSSGGARESGGQSGSGGRADSDGSMGSAGTAGTTGRNDADTSGSGTGPCDIYAAGNTPCVAAYSTTRALYGAYGGSLYQVKKADGTTKDIGVLATGGISDAAAQDTFCSGTTCTISIIYDQSGKGNHLTKAPGGSATYGPNPDVEAVADALPITLGGHKVYGVHVVGAPGWTEPGQVGYRNTKTNGTARGDNPETEYMVTDGTYYNGSCCFDFGNAEMQPVAGGYGTMEAIYFGSCDWWDKGSGKGPWIMADLEVGVYNMGGANAYSDANKNGNKTNSDDLSFTYPFVTAMLKGNSSKATNGGPFTLKGGNAQSGMLTTIWDGAYPVGYFPMNRQGGVVLGVGGDNSSMARGNFYEGVMTIGYASTATDDAVQANIVAAKYGK